MTLNRISLFRGDDFQEFCSVLLSKVDKGFQAVDGRGGDDGNDGFSVAGDTVYQAYGPERRDSARVLRKIGDSVFKARKLQANGFPALKRFVFLTPFDLTVEQHKALARAATGVGMLGESWGESRLLALLCSHPEVKAEFPTILLPDVLEEIRRLSERRNQTQEEMLDEWGADVADLHHLLVLQKSEMQEDGDHYAYRYFKVHLSNPALARQSIEPEEEQAFLDAIRERFWEDTGAVLSSPTSSRVLVENRDSELRFHRAWGWWTDGTIAMAGTLADLNRPGFYSAAELIIDITRFFRLASLMGVQGQGLIRVGYDPQFLSVHFEPSDRRAQLRPTLQLGGIQHVGRAALKERSREGARVAALDLSGLAVDAHQTVAELVVPLLRDFHLARISTAALSASIPDLLSGARDLLVL